MQGAATDQTRERGGGKRKGRKMEVGPSIPNLRDQVSGGPTAETYRIPEWPHRLILPVPQQLGAKKEQRDRKGRTKTTQKRKDEAKTQEKQVRQENQTGKSYAARLQDSVSGEPPADTPNDSRVRCGIPAGRIRRFRDDWKRERSEKGWGRRGRSKNSGR